MIDVKELRALAKFGGHAAVSAVDINELLDRMEAAEKGLEKCRSAHLNGKDLYCGVVEQCKDSELRASQAGMRLRRAEAERAALAADLDQIRRAVPEDGISHRPQDVVKDVAVILRQAHTATINSLARRGGETIPKWKYDATVNWCKQVEDARDDALRRLHDLNEGDTTEAWRWMGDGNDHLESLTCPMLISANALRSLIAEKQAEAVEKLRDELRSDMPHATAVVAMLDAMSLRADTLRRQAGEGK